MNLLNKNIVITGASRGLGLEISKKFSQQGANLILCARDLDELKVSSKTLIDEKKDLQKIYTIKADVSNKNDVKNLYNETIKKLNGCDVIINNAGVYGAFGNIEEINWDEWLEGININLFGSVMVCKEFIPYFKNQSHGKIIQISGGGATTPMPKISSYAVSKAAIVRFIESISLELEEYGIYANCVAPGLMNTEMLRNVIDAGPDKVGVPFYKKMLDFENKTTDYNKILDLIIFLSTKDSDGISGKLISAQWDNWKDWPKNLDKLKNEDVYTLRRIVGRDRNCSWGDV